MQLKLVPLMFVRHTSNLGTVSGRGSLFGPVVMTHLPGMPLFSNLYPEALES